ncbi:MAG: transcriptional repressor [Prevotellaceae bacterium]|jgi:Fur family ferric uptake transcriptional regulator|nr:transcriptional repressor [Prevotellaceae bacterium]
MKAYEVLVNHGLKRTSCREGIISVVMSSNQALSEEEIRSKLPGNYDRTTFYRSFKTLEENKIIHKIVVDNLLVKYAFGNPVPADSEHAHFFCVDCNTVQCLDSVHIDKPQLPEGYAYAGTDMIIKGVCNKCKAP